MPNITIIGLGRQGSALTAALKKQSPSVSLTGCDLERSAEKTAGSSGIVHRICHNIPEAVREAETVILAIPADQTKYTLELIGKDLPENTVILDLCPVKKAASGWAAQYLRKPENFLGIWIGSRENAPETDPLEGGVLIAAVEIDNSTEAVQTASKLASLLKMTCVFSDPMELDGWIAAAYSLPKLTADTLVGCLMKRPGWKDGQKAAGTELLAALSPAGEKMDRDEAGFTLLHSRENTLHLLDEYIAAMKTCRDLIQNKDQVGLRLWLNENEKLLTQWKAEMRKPAQSSETDPGSDISASDMLEQTFFGGFLRKKIKK